MKGEGFYVVRCNSPKCKEWQIIEIRKVEISKKSFKCKYCGYSSRYHKEGKFAKLVEYKGPFDVNTASRVCSELKIEKKIDEGFFEHRIRGKK